MKITDYRKIPQYTRAPSYQVDMPLDFTLDWLEKNQVNTDPDFQRAHVWVEEQQIRFVEHMFRGGTDGKLIYFNQPGWNRGTIGDMVLVDGKQRLEAVRRFLQNEIPIFGSLRDEYTTRHDVMMGFRFLVNDLQTHKEVLQWYIDINAGGVAHTDDEIDKVRALLKEEK